MMRRLRYLFEIFREDLQIKTNFVICSFNFYFFFVNDEINDQSPDDKLSFKDN